MPRNRFPKKNPVIVAITKAAVVVGVIVGILAVFIALASFVQDFYSRIDQVNAQSTSNADDAAYRSTLIALLQGYKDDRSQIETVQAKNLTPSGDTNHQLEALIKTQVALEEKILELDATTTAIARNGKVTPIPAQTDTPSSRPTPTIRSMGLIANAPTPIPVIESGIDWFDNFSSDSPNWDVFSTRQGSAGYENNQFYVEAIDSIFIALWQDVGEIGNAVIEVETLGPFQGKSTEGQGIVFGWKRAWNSDTYVFTINSNGTCGIWIHKKGEESFLGYYEYLSNLPDNFDYQSGHLLRIELMGDKALGFVDGKYCTEVPLVNYKTGFVGLGASSGDMPNVKYYFDNYRVYLSP